MILFWGGMVFLALWRFLLAIFLPLTPDEAYYWIWAVHFQSGYYDHPFMVALWARIGNFLFGAYPFSVRFLGPVAAVIASFAFYDTARCLFPARRDAAIWAVCFLNITLVSGLGMVVMTPDTPQLFFVVLSLWTLSRALQAGVLRRAWIWWGGVGLSLGLGADSKYTMALIGAGIAGFLLSDARRLWCHSGPYIAAFLALTGFLPVILWNEAHHWASFVKQGGRVWDWHPQRAVQFLSELVAGQVGLITPLLFVLCLCGLWRVRREAPLLPWLVLPGGIVFFLHAFGDRVQANWPSVLYPPFLMAGAWLAVERKIWARWAAGCGAAMLVLLSVQALWTVIPLPGYYDPIARQSAGWNMLAQQLQQQAERRGADAVLVRDYALASILSAQPSLHLPVLGEEQRWAFLQGLRLHKAFHALALEEERHGLTVGDTRLYRTGKGHVIRCYRLWTVGEKEGFWINQTGPL